MLKLILLWDPIAWLRTPSHGWQRSQKLDAKNETNIHHSSRLLEMCLCANGTPRSLCQETCEASVQFETENENAKIQVSSSS